MVNTISHFVRLAKLSAELGESLLEVQRKIRYSFVEDGFVCKVHTFVSYKKLETVTTNKIWQIPVASVQSNAFSNVG